jgi:AraC family transcriptional regulator
MLMTRDSAPTIDLTSQQEAAQVLPHTPLFASYEVGWQGITFTHYCAPSNETVEHYLQQHAIVVTGSQSSFQAEHRLDGQFKRYSHGNGRVDVIPAFLSHWTNWDRQAEFSVIAVCPTFLNRVVRETCGRGIELMPQFSIDDPVIQHLALALKAEIQAGCMSGKLYGESLATALASRLVQNYAVDKPQIEFSPNGLPRSQLLKVMDYINARLQQDLSILDLAKLTRMSESHFSRSFKQSVGVAPYQYLMQQRVEKAKKLLQQREMSITDISLNCGFANQTHLTKVFRQITGVTPKTYRNQ